MDVCIRCGLSDSPLIKGKKHCRRCNNEYGRKYYIQHREERLKKIYVNVKALKKRRKEFVDELKNKPCMDCKNRFPSVCMDFDHRDETQKKFNIAAMIGQGGFSLETLKAEIAKCDLVCANCHRIRTHITRKITPLAQSRASA